MIQLFHVYKAYGPESAALQDINLDLEKGEGVFLTGHSGAGKSTLLKLIFADERVSQGQILVDGINLTRIRRNMIPRLRRNIGVVFQDFKLLYTRSVFENVAFTLEVLGISKREIAKRVRSILRLVGLEHKINSSPLSLSGGEQQRVAIARAIINEPKILLADEPTGNLDPEKSHEIMDYLKRINARGTTVVIATHDMSLVKKTAWKRVHLNQGRIISIN